MFRPAHAFFSRLARHQISLVAAGRAFFGTLAVVPALSVLVALYGLVSNPTRAAAQLNLARDLLPPEAYGLIAQQLHRLVTAPHHTLGLSVASFLLATFWSASTGTKSMIAGLNLAQGHAESRSMLRFQATGLALTLAAMLAGILTIALLVALPPALRQLGLPRHDRALLHAASLALMLLFVAALLAALYRFGPTKRPARIWPGALAGTALWLAATFAFTTLTETTFRLAATYGPLASVAGLMLWFWVSAYATLIGAELNAILSL
jgi:membrane protein